MFSMISIGKYLEETFGLPVFYSNHGIPDGAHIRLFEPNTSSGMTQSNSVFNQTVYIAVRTGTLDWLPVENYVNILSKLRHQRIKSENAVAYIASVSTDTKINTAENNGGIDERVINCTLVLKIS